MLYILIRWINNRITIASNWHAKQQTHLPSLPASGTDPSQAAKQSPNRTLKPAHPPPSVPLDPATGQTHQCREKGRERKRKRNGVSLNVKQCDTYLILTKTFYPSSKSCVKKRRKEMSEECSGHPPWPTDQTRPAPSPQASTGESGE